MPGADGLGQQPEDGAEHDHHADCHWRVVQHGAGNRVDCQQAEHGLQIYCLQSVMRWSQKAAAAFNLQSSQNSSAHRFWLRLHSSALGTSPGCGKWTNRDEGDPCDRSPANYLRKRSQMERALHKVLLANRQPGEDWKGIAAPCTKHSSEAAHANQFTVGVRTCLR